MIIPVNYCQANFRFEGVAAPLGAEFTQAYSIEAFAPGNPTAAADELADAFSPNVMVELSTELTFVECMVKFGPNDVGPAGSAVRSIAGGQAQSAVPPNSAVLVRKNTAVGGRRGRGRLYCPGVGEGLINGSGNLSAALLNTLQVAFDDFSAATIALGLLPVVLHMPGISATPAPTEMLSYSVQPKLATQRDRLRR